MNLDIQLLRSSFELVVDREPELTAAFYRRLFSDFPQAKALFGRNSERAQQEMLRDALIAVLDHLEDAPWLDNTLRALGARHHEYGVTPQMYDWVGQSLLATLAEIADDAWTPALAEAWGAAYGLIAQTMQAGALTKTEEIVAPVRPAASPGSSSA